MHKQAPTAKTINILFHKQAVCKMEYKIEGLLDKCR